MCTKYSELLATLIRPNNYLTQFDHYALPPAVPKSPWATEHTVHKGCLKYVVFGVGLFVVVVCSVVVCVPVCFCPLYLSIYLRI